MEDVMKMQRREVLGMLTAAAGSVLLPEPYAAAEPTPAANPMPKERVTGIGGIFFRAHIPSRWRNGIRTTWVSP
jgi:glyoxylase I family protein